MAEYIVDTTEGVLHARTTGELVRCRDCVYLEMHRLLGGVAATCYLDGGDGICSSLDGYCSNAVRREGRHGGGD
ncbi:MAG: hypothetical protein MSA61_09735 [Coriobacteriaceae bacterium]|nr:hypothetical protein [Coriobacteriaceae bacterium]